MYTPILEVTYVSSLWEGYSRLFEIAVGLVFFDMPHAGGSESLVALGKTCARNVTALSSALSNDIMEAVQHGLLFSDVPQENGRHQLTSYKIARKE